MTKVPAPAGYSTTQGDVIHRLPVEAFPGLWANVYLVDTGDWRVLIDSGSGSEASNSNLEAGLSQVGVSFGEITHILLTHGHIDHYGGLTFLRERTNAQIIVHELDFQTIARHKGRLAVLVRRLDSFLVGAGVSEEQRTEILQMYRFTKALYSSVHVDAFYEGVGMQVGPFEVLHLPGHCPGHVGLKLHDALFCGDLVLEGLTPHQSPEEITPFLGVRHYLNSLSNLERWGAVSRLILNGHDDPLVDLPARIAIIRKNLSRRIFQTMQALGEAGTISEVTARVYGDMGGYNALLVIEKIGAYVEYLCQRGLLEIVNPDELEAGKHLVPIRYRSVREVSEVEILPEERVYVFI